jgi:hypothetical protein
MCIYLPLIQRQLQGQDTDIANSSIALFLVLSTEELTTSRLNNILANCNHDVVQILFTMWGKGRNERHYLLFCHTCSCNLHIDSPLSSPHLPAQPDPLVLLSNQISLTSKILHNSNSKRTWSRQKNNLHVKFVQCLWSLAVGNIDTYWVPCLLTLKELASQAWTNAVPEWAYTML